MKELRLTNGGPALVDDEDYDRCAAHTWALNKEGYVQCSRPPMRLHRFILNLGRNDPEADHINRNPWDNRKCNLRLATRSQNCANATKQKGTLSQFKGVRYHEGRWKARITAGGKMHIGTFDSEIEAARAYDCKAREIYGEFAAVNFPNSHLEPPVKMGRNFGIKRCKHCGNTFTPYVRRHTYCKTKCRLASKGCK